MLENNFAIAELQRKLANIIRVGIVEKVDYEKARVKVKIGEFVTDWLPWITSRAETWSPPNIDEQVVVLSPLGELSLGVVLPAIYQQKYPAPESSKMINSLVFQDGTKLSYDKENHHFKVDVMNKLTLKVGDTVLLVNKKIIKIESKLPEYFYYIVTSQRYFQLIMKQWCR